ncbi:MAG TPA: TOBE domain-containing protein, partial [Anaerolineae bacterium]|nr:TOBE domain-containing protein [Anaerolineae bacterium]
QEEALTMSDRIAVMHQGKVLHVGPPTEIYERPSCRFVADFIGDTNFMEGVVQEQNGSVTTVLVDNCLPVRVQSEEGLAAGTQVTVAVRPEKIRLLPEPLRGSHNSFLGRIEQVVYVGTDTRFRIRLSEHVSLSVREQNVVSDPNATTYYPTGEASAFAVWLDDAGRILSD